jgi:hypothetical protein
MTLDDRSLRVHIDRRAEAGATDPQAVADATMSRVAAPEPWWRGVASRPVRGLPAAAAGLAILLFAVTMAPRWLGSGPGASPGTTGATGGPEYPAERPLTAAELDDLLGPDPRLRASVTLVADVELRPQSEVLCGLLTDCPEYVLQLPSGEHYVQAGPDPLLSAPYAFRVREDGALDLLGSVRPGPDGLAWTLPKLLEVVPGARAGDRAVQYLYLVDAVRVVSTWAYRCPANIFPSNPAFQCGTGSAWLIPVGSPVPTSWASAPPESLRVPNITPVAVDSGAHDEHGYWLIDPLVAQDLDRCFLCPPAGAADLIGRVLTPEELDHTPSPTPTATISALSVENIAFSSELVTLDGFETADVNVTVSFAGDVVQYHDINASLTPLICLERDGTADAIDPHPLALSRTLVQIGGTNPWVASFRLTSGDQGTWRVTCVVAYDADGNELIVNPSLGGASPKLEVIGTHAPHLTMEFKPSPAEIGQALEVFGRVTDADTGDALAGVVVTIGRGVVCTQGGSGTTITTNPNGAYTYVIPEADEAVVCTWITDLDGVYPDVSTDPIAIYALLLAHPTEP